MWMSGSSRTATRRCGRSQSQRLQVNVELASPLDFLPPLPRWQERSRFRLRAGNLEVFDFDPYSQALAKLERGFELDLDDVSKMVQAGHVESGKLLELLDEIEGDLFRFPAVDPRQLRRAVEDL